MSLVLKLSKCRLCLKLGDFYSIFAVDNSTQLSKMAMACSEIKIHEGDGLPDKICGECVEKLSAAFIFKQQCERSDAELRKSHPIADISSYGRRNSDSGFSNRTDVSTTKKDSSQPVIRSKRKRPNEVEEGSSKVYSTEDGLLQESYSIDITDPLSFEGTSGENSSKKRRRSVSSDSESNSVDEDDEDNLFKCHEQGCNEMFTSAKSLDAHADVHKSTTVPSNLENAGGFPCLTCGKRFKLNVMLNKHMKDCKIQFKPITTKFNWSLIINRTLKCPVCLKVYKKRIYLRKHLKRNACGDVIRENPDDFIPKSMQKPITKNLAVECSNCDAEFPTYGEMYRHITLCLRQRGTGLIKCNTCDITYMKRESLNRHIKKTHSEDDTEHKEAQMSSRNSSLLNESKTNANSAGDGLLKCRECHQTFNDQMQLVMHLAAHMANKKDQMSRDALVEVPFMKDYVCTVCNKQFKYRLSMLKHMKVEHGQETSEVRANHTFNCELCDKTFMFRKSLIYHKNAKHNSENASSTPFYHELIEFSKCKAKCLHCNKTLENFSATKAHNRIHIEGNEKVKNEYTCPACNLQFTNTKFFRAHLSHHNSNLKQRTAESADNIDYVENRPGDFGDNVLVKIKVEPSDLGDFRSALSDQGNSSTGQRLVVNMRGFTCPVCGKTLETLENYQQHVNEHSTMVHGGGSDSNIACLVCTESFETDEQLNEHLQAHMQESLSNPASLICIICKLKAKNFRGLYAHMKWHKQTTDFSCRICKMNFATKTAYLSHQKTHIVYDSIDSISTEFTSEATPSGHQCKICQKYMLNTTSLKKHLGWHAQKNSNQKANYFCSACHKAFTNKNTHKLHMRVHLQNSSGRHICPICMKYMKSAVHLSVHIKTHSDMPDVPLKPKYKKMKLAVPCPVCEREFSHQVMLNKHLQNAHPGSKMVKKNDPDAEVDDKKHICTICAKEFPSEHRLTRHLAMHNMKVSFFKCKICDKKLKSIKAHRTHIKGHMFQKYTIPVKCDHCDECFSRRLDMHRHLIAVHNITESYTAVMGPEFYTNTLEKSKKFSLQDLGGFQCSLCNKFLSGENQFQRHMEFHNTMRCNYCFEYFNNKMFLDAHTKYSCDRKKVLGDRDSFDKRLKCHLCYKPFSIAIKLRCHLRVAHDIELSETDNTGTTTSLCDFCFNEFPNEANMLKHKRCHTRNGFFGCKLCPKKFSTLTLFQRHRKRHLYVVNVDNPTKCEHCDESFPAYNKYVIHLKEIHNEDTDWLIPPKPSPIQNCNICNKDFSNLHNHMMYHEKYKCPKCCEYFLSASKFQDHSCSFDSEGDDAADVPGGPDRDSPDYKECDFCFKPINKVSTATRHYTNHTKIVHFGCRFCDKKFTIMSSFNIHGYSHRHRTYKKNPLRCRHCGDSFYRYAAYVAHLRSTHNDHETLLFKPKLQEEDCILCNKRFPNISLHYKHHLNFKCNVCQKYILSEKLFYDHVCNDPSADPSLFVEYNEDLLPLTVQRYNDECEMRHRQDSVVFSDDYFKEKLGENYSFGNNSIDIDETTLNESILANALGLNNDTVVSIPDNFFDADGSNQSSSFDNCTPIISSTVSLSLGAAKSLQISNPCTVEEIADVSKVDDNDESMENPEVSQDGDSTNDSSIIEFTNVPKDDDSFALKNTDVSRVGDNSESIMENPDASQEGDSTCDSSILEHTNVTKSGENDISIVENTDVSKRVDDDSSVEVGADVSKLSDSVCDVSNTKSNIIDVEDEDLCILENAVETCDLTKESGCTKLSELKNADVFEQGIVGAQGPDKILEAYNLNPLAEMEMKGIVEGNFDQSSQEMTTSSISENVGIEIDGTT